MAVDTAISIAGQATGPVRLTLTGEFELFLAGQQLTIPHSVERVLAYLALTERPVSRAKLAGVLWIDASQERAANNLRTTLWRLGRSGRRLVSADTERLVLASEVSVDAVELSALARRLIHAPGVDDLHQVPQLITHGELLPDWDDGWIAADRERFRLLRLEALDHAAGILIEQHRPGEALIAALASVHTEPLRESCRRLVIQVHVAEGNIAEALRSYRAYRTLLWEELGIEPSLLMQQLVAPLGPQPR